MWECCDLELLDSMDECPECGRTKASWTLRYDKTRVFTIGKLDWIEVQLLDDYGDPVPNYPYILELPDGTKREGNLDENGCVLEEKIPRGICKVSFPEVDQHDLEPKDPKTDWIELQFLDTNGMPHSGECYKVTFFDREVRQGTLDDNGFVRLEDVYSGVASVLFPNLDEAQWERADDT